MIVVMLQDVKTAPIAPESRRDRFLHCTYGSFHGEGNVRFNSPYSYNFIRKYFYNLSEPESVTAYSIDSSESVVSVPGRHTVGVERRLTDANFWRVFDFTFIAGAPYTTDDVDAAMPLAVITESVARSLFGSTDVAGREFSIDYKPMRVCGVVRDVTPLAFAADRALVHLEIVKTYTFTMQHHLLVAVGTTLLMAVMIAVGIWIPAYRAGRISPALALRSE